MRLSAALLAGAGLLLAASAACAQTALSTGTPEVAISSAAPARTLRDVVDLALKTGRDDLLDEATSRSLGLGDAEIPVRLLAQRRGEAEHLFGVLFVDKEEGPEPKGVVLSVSVSSAGVVERQGFRLTLDAQLRGALTATGPAKKLKYARLPLPSAAAQEGYRRELEFWLSSPPPLPPAPPKP